MVVLNLGKSTVIVMTFTESCNIRSVKCHQVSLIDILPKPEKNLLLVFYLRILIYKSYLN